MVYTGIGPVTHSDVQLAAAADASILAFNVKAAAPAVEAEAKQHAVTTCAQVLAPPPLKHVPPWVVDMDCCQLSTPHSLAVMVP